MAHRSSDEIDELVRLLGRHGFGGLNPDTAQLRSFIAADRGGPLQFLNLLAYHDLARYPEGHELAQSGLSGADAYGRYGMVALEQVTRRGGHLSLYNHVEQVLIGATGTWQEVAIMEYPDSEAFLDIIADPEYAAGLVHRDAGLAETVVLVSRSLLPPTGN